MKFPGRIFIILASIAFLCVSVIPALAGDFWVSPIKLFFDAKTRSGVVSVTNNGDTDMRFTVQASKWSQDEEGKDVYTRATDLHFYPRSFELKAKQTQAIRTGIKIPATKTEKTYRLFIKDIPNAPQRGEAAQLSISMRFGVPVFAAPSVPSWQGAVTDLLVSAGEVSFLIENTGNTHFQPKAVTLTGTNQAGQTVHTEELRVWYVLTGMKRPYTAVLPQDICDKISVLTIDVPTEHGTYTGSINVKEPMCR